jgi:hypothetical protein
MLHSVRELHARKTPISSPEIWAFCNVYELCDSQAGRFTPQLLQFPAKNRGLKRIHSNRVYNFLHAD